ncbi:MAG TPA: cytochrome C biogenesis protein [Bacteroidetes bacterium]|nr:cytochrome C biogenesis protein [Bacteroidota bacterium]
MKKIAILFFSMKTMAVLVAVFAVSIAAATFIENDFGTEIARQRVYNARWFEWLLILIAINLLGNVVTRKLYRPAKWPVGIFHLAFVVIIAGAALTRYLGYEGLMHIREGESSRMLLGGGRAFQVWVDNGEKPGLTVDLSYRNLQRTGFTESLCLNGNEIRFRKTGFIPRAVQTVTEQPDGDTVLAMVLLSDYSRKTVYIENHTAFHGAGVSFSFNKEDFSSLVNIRQRNGNLYLVSDSVLRVRDMTSPADSLLNPQEWHPFRQRKIYRLGEERFVLQQLHPSAAVQWITAPHAASDDSPADVLQVEIVYENGVKRAEMPYDAEFSGGGTVVNAGENELILTFAPPVYLLPFSVYLHDFILERYPGSDSPASYASWVTLTDQARDVKKDYRIYMNNILKYRGYRFYQSSYDPDEKGTVLSVNHDRPGTVVTYAGYFLLVAGMLITLVHPRSRFRTLLRKMGNKTGMILAGFLVISSAQGFAQERNGFLLPEKEQTKSFGRALVQSGQGRIRPVHSLAADMVHKVTRKDRFNGWHPMQIFLGMHLDPYGWQSVKMIRIPGTEVARFLGTEGTYASFTDFFDLGEDPPRYRLTGPVNRAYAKSLAERTRFDKDILQVDERVNVVYMTFSGQFLRMFPRENDPDHTWYAPHQAGLFESREDSVFVASLAETYFEAFREGMQTGNYSGADELLHYLRVYQQEKSTLEIPGPFRVRLEILYHEWNVFKRLFRVYGITGLLFMLLLLVQVVIPRLQVNGIVRSVKVFLLVCFAFHTVGLAARWVIAGHAPWSNGYESMIYVSWATMLAGFLFSRRTAVALAAASVLAALTLFVAHLSWMNPEITRLVPVLQSYWLTLHVSVITASYGFFGLSAILGLVNILLFSLKNTGNQERIDTHIRELTRVSELSLLPGLFLLTTGTVLGAVWANESWGRYWGWDPKETWSLVTILVYTLIVHMRLIPGMMNVYRFNLAALTGFSSVLMTYFGVNYYLSGLHSYAGGDPVPVPGFLYFAVGGFVLLALLAWWKQKRFQAESTGD